MRTADGRVLLTLKTEWSDGTTHLWFEPIELLERLAANYPVPRLGTALEVADLISFAASEAAGYITGASLDINGGDLMM